MQIPILIDTDFGGDPDDSIAIYYALKTRELQLISFISSDEYNKDWRARSLHTWLNECGQNIPVYVGCDLGHKDLFFLDSYLGDDKNLETIYSSSLEKQLKILADNKGWYISIGGLTNLQYLYQKYPTLLQKISIAIMGGATKYPRPHTAEHNVRLDIPAAKKIFNSSLQTYWVLADITFAKEMEISSKHKLYELISNNSGLKLLKDNIDAFFKHKYSTSHLHDPLTIASVFSSFISFENKQILFKETGELEFSSEGKLSYVSSAVKFDLFWDDLMKKFN